MVDKLQMFNNEAMEAGHAFGDFVFWGFYSLLGAVISYIGYKLTVDFRDTARSLQSLAVAVAELTIRLGSFERSLDRLDARLQKLEDFRHMDGE